MESSSSSASTLPPPDSSPSASSTGDPPTPALISFLPTTAASASMLDNLGLLGLATLAVSLQLYVIGLVVWRSPKEMHDYRVFICLCTLYDFLFTVSLSFGAAPVSMIPWCAAQRFRGFFTLFGPYGANIGSFCITFWAVMMVGAEIHSLVYRFSAIQQRFPWVARQLAGWRWIAATTALLATVAAGIAACFGHYTQTPEEFAWAMENEPSFCRRVPYFPWFRPGESVVASFHMFRIWAEPLLPLLLLAAMALAEGLSILFSVFTIRLLRRNVHAFSPKTYRMHLQLIMLLLAQLLAPVLFVMVPLCVLCAHLAFGSDSTATYSDLVMLQLTAYGLTNSLLTVAFIAPYRRFTLELLTCRRCRPPSTPTTTHGGGIQQLHLGRPKVTATAAPVVQPSSRVAPAKAWARRSLAAGVDGISRGSSWRQGRKGQQQLAGPGAVQA